VGGEILDRNGIRFGGLRNGEYHAFWLRDWEEFVPRACVLHSAPLHRIFPSLGAIPFRIGVSVVRSGSNRPKVLFKKKKSSKSVK
jgi:hypothetical protein